MKFAILAVVVAMVTLSEGYIGGSIGIGYPGYAYPGYAYRKNAASSTYDYTNSNGDECVCTAPVVVPEPEVEPVHEPECVTSDMGTVHVARKGRTVKYRG